MLPPDPVPKKRGKKTLLRRRELGEETSGFTHGRVTKKGVSMKCSVCGAKGHNKRHHKDNNVTDGHTGEQGHQESHEATDPLTTIDSQVLHAHFEMVDNLIGANQQEGGHCQNPGEPVPQVINELEQNMGSRAILSDGHGRKKLTTIRGKQKPVNDADVGHVNQSCSKLQRSHQTRILQELQ